MSLFHTALTAFTLAFAALSGGAQAGATTAGDSYPRINYLFDSHAPVLVSGDDDLCTWSSNWCTYKAWIEHEVVDDRKVVCTVWSSAEERLGSTKFIFPAKSYVIYTAPSGKCIEGFRFSGHEPYRDYSMKYQSKMESMSSYHHHAIVSFSPTAYDWMFINGDRWGSDRGMNWRYSGFIELKVSSINYSHPGLPGSLVAPRGGFGR